MPQGDAWTRIGRGNHTDADVEAVLTWCVLELSRARLARTLLLSLDEVDVEELAAVLDGGTDELDQLERQIGD